MPDYLRTLRQFVSGDYLRSGNSDWTRQQREPVEVKFNPADAGVDWTYVQHLVLTANAEPQSNEHRGDGNSAVFACLRALALASIEPPLRVFRQEDDGDENWLQEHPMQQVLNRPTDRWMTIRELRFWITWVKHLDGNAYLMKVRAGDRTGGNVIELWPISPSRMRPWTDKNSSNFIDSYRWQKAGGEVEFVPPENIIHFKFGIDDRDVRRGLAPIKRLVREVASDGEATRWMDALLRNFGIPGLVVELPAVGPNNTPLPPIAPDKLTQMKADIKATYGTDQRGGVGLLTGGATMKQFGFNPEQMNLKALHEVPETRICAVMGVDPLVARLGVGLEQTSNYASARQVRENFTENTLIPLWQMDEDKWNEALRADFTSDERVVIKHDLSEVRALQEDRNALWLRVTEAFKNGMLTPEAVESLLELPPGSVPEPVEPASPSSSSVSSEELEVQSSRNALALKATDIERWPDMMKALVELAEPGFREDFDRLMDAQRRRIKREILSET